MGSIGPNRKYRSIKERRTRQKRVTIGQKGKHRNKREHWTKEGPTGPDVSIGQKGTIGT